MYVRKLNFVARGDMNLVPWTITSTRGPQTGVHDNGHARGEHEDGGHEGGTVISLAQYHPRPPRRSAGPPRLAPYQPVPSLSSPSPSPPPQKPSPSRLFSRVSSVRTLGIYIRSNHKTRVFTTLHQASGRISPSQVAVRAAVHIMVIIVSEKPLKATGRPGYSCSGVASPSLCKYSNTIPTRSYLSISAADFPRRRYA